MSQESDPYSPPQAVVALNPNSPPGAHPPGHDASPEEKDKWWFENVYQGDRQKQLTWRAVLTGGILGAVLSLSNLYTTLRIGWAFGVAITACVMSWAMWKGLRALSGGKMSEMSILENNCMQSTASSAGYSTGSVVGTACAALLMVNNGAHMPWYVLTPFVFLTAVLGVLMAIPMKRQMINHEQLQFPSGIAAAETLKSLYAEGIEASKKAFALLWSLGIAALLAVFRKAGDVVQEFPNWLGDKTTEAVVKFSTAIQDVPLWQPYPVSPASLKPVAFAELKFDPSLLTIGAGMIVGLRASVAMLIGSAILHYGLGPALIEHEAVKLAANKAGAFVADEHGHNVAVLFRWGVWGGTALMVMASLTSLVFQWKSIARAFKKKSGGGNVGEAQAAIEVPGSWMLIGLIPVIIGLVITLDWGLGVPWYLGLIGTLMAFPLALVACRATGETDTTPIGAMGKVTQLAFAVMHPGNKVTNLATAGTTSAAAASAADLLTDLKSGYILGANPKRQFLAQLAGVFFGTAMIIPAWYLLAGDYAKLQEKFPMQAASAWRAMAELLNPGDGKSAFDALPWGAATAIIIGAVLGILLPVLEKLFPKHRNWIPSAMGLGLGFVIDFASGLGFTIGAFIAWVWKKRNAAQADAYTVPVGSGFVAGQALMEAVIIITVAALTLKR
jgi:OPT family oligopeptide transporter